MVHNYYLEEAKKMEQLQKDKALNTKPSVQQYARLPNTLNGNKPKPGNFNQQRKKWPPSMSICVSNRIVNIAEPPRNQNPFLKSKGLACPTCKKCICSANHDECIVKYISKLADLFTKALPEDRFKYLVRRLGMRCLAPNELEVLSNRFKNDLPFKPRWGNDPGKLRATPDLLISLVTMRLITMSRMFKRKSEILDGNDNGYTPLFGKQFLALELLRPAGEILEFSFDIYAAMNTTTMAGKD
nr:hypothetical protein [Tanacetum cinerariifolium]